MMGTRLCGSRVLYPAVAPSWPGNAPDVLRVGFFMTPKTWFITGTSRGFGREWTIAALDRGDKVAATARNISQLDDIVAVYGDAILPITPAVTDRDRVLPGVRIVGA